MPPRKGRTDERADPSTTSDSMHIDAITVGPRIRRDYGDIEALAADIAAVGLLHPPVVTPLGELIAGERRLRALRHLGWTEVPVTIVDLDEIVRGEFSENTMRKDFTPSEIASIAAALRPLEEQAAKERQRANLMQGDAAPVTQSLRDGPTEAAGEVREKIAAATGVSREQVRKIEAVVAAAEREPAVYAPLVEEMDRTGKVDHAFREVRRVEAEREQVETDNVLAKATEAVPGARERMEQTRLRSAWIVALAGLRRHLNDMADPAVVIDLLTTEDREHLARELVAVHDWAARWDAALAASNGLHAVGGTSDGSTK